MASTVLYGKPAAEDIPEQESSCSEISDDASLSDIFPSPFDSPKPESISDVDSVKLEHWTREVVPAANIVPRAYILPRFGCSPGPSPTLTPQSSRTVTPVPEDQDLVEEDEIAEEDAEAEPNEITTAVQKGDSKEKPGKVTTFALRQEKKTLAERMAEAAEDFDFGAAGKRPPGRGGKRAVPSSSSAGRGGGKEEAPRGSSGGGGGRRRTPEKKTKKGGGARRKERPQEEHEDPSRQTDIETAVDEDILARTGEPHIVTVSLDSGVVSGEKRVTSIPDEGKKSTGAISTSLPGEELDLSKLVPAQSRPPKKVESVRTPLRRTFIPMSGARHRGVLAGPEVDKSSEETAENAKVLSSEEMIALLSDLSPEKLSQLTHEDLVTMGMGSLDDLLPSGGAGAFGAGQLKMPPAVYRMLMLKKLEKYSGQLQDHPYYLLKRAKSAGPSTGSSDSRPRGRPLKKGSERPQTQPSSEDLQIKNDPAYLELIDMLHHERSIFSEHAASSQGHTDMLGYYWSGVDQLGSLTDDEAALWLENEWDTQQEYFKRLSSYYFKLFEKFQTTHPEIPADRLVQNDGVEVLSTLAKLERHALLKIGRQLRTILTSERNQIEVEDKKDRQTKLPGHRYCRTLGATPIGGCRLSRSALAGRSRSSMSPAPPLSRPPTRSNTADDATPGTIFCDICAMEHEGTIEVPSVTVSPFPHGRHQHQRRVQTAMPGLSRPSRPVTAVDSRKAEVADSTRPETPFRLASRERCMSASDWSSQQTNQKSVIRPAVIRRTPPSIPGRSKNYILMHYQKVQEFDQLPEASLQEERLIRSRFPQFKDRWLGDYSAMEPRPWMCCLKDGYVP